MDDEPADPTDALGGADPETNGARAAQAKAHPLDSALADLVDGYVAPGEAAAAGVDTGPDLWAATTSIAANPLGVDTIVAEHDDDAVGGRHGDGGGRPPASASPRNAPQKPPWRAIREWMTVLVIALGAAVIIRVFVFQQYYIDGPSMEHTLEPHDRVLVNKLSYRLHDVRRGDVVVFDRVTTAGTAVQHDDLIKRVIGLPGETVSIQSCNVFIDGRQLDEPYLSTEIMSQPDPVSRCRITDLAPEVIPDGEVFVMGDNRPQSFDSREFGPIDTDLIRGRAFVVLWPFSNWRWL
jgi:signal peptidase I